jgi:hypothetical protein
VVWFFPAVSKRQMFVSTLLQVGWNKARPNSLERKIGGLPPLERKVAQMDGQIYGMLLWVWLLTVPLVLGFISLLSTKSANSRAFENQGEQQTSAFRTR